MERINIDELLSKGFTEDPDGIRKFKRLFLVPAIIGLCVYVVCFVLVVSRKHDIRGPLIGLAVSWILLGVMMVIMYKSRPKSRFTGKPLLKYKNSAPVGNVATEIIYVCPDSKTFSRRVYVVRGGGHAVAGCA
jgi:hypothetical protein